MAREVETALGTKPKEFFQYMYGNQPNRWDDGLREPERLRVVVNAFTRLRYCDAEGRMDLEEKGTPGSQPPNLLPWFEVPHRRSRDIRVVFGHWSALGRHQSNNVISLDSGCVWNRALTAVRLDRDVPEFHEITCQP